MAMDTDVRADFNAHHPHEWRIHARGFDLANFLPQRAVARLAQTLGADFRVENRGSRVEISSPRFRGEDGHPHRELIEAALPAFARALYGRTRAHTYEVKLY